MQQIRLASGNGQAPAQTAPLSVIDGGPAPKADVTSLAQLLPRAVRLNPERAIRLITMDGTESGMSYAELLVEASRVLAGLRAVGVQPADRVVLLVRSSRDLLVAFWACVLGGFVVVPVGAQATDAGHAITEAMARRIWHTLGCRWLVADYAVTEGPVWLGTVAQLGGGSPDSDWFTSDWDDVALLTMTAGSTGTPKTVMLSHGNILSRSAATVHDNGLDSTAVTFNWMPLDHVGGLVMFHLRDVYLGCTQVHAPKAWIRQDPLRWLYIVDRYRVTVGWGTNSALDLIAAHASKNTARTWDLNHLGYIMNGGEPVKARTIHRFFAALSRYGLPSTAMRPGWGMSETAGGVVDHRLDLADLPENARFVPVGKPHTGMSVRVVDETGQIVQEGLLGRLQIRGSSITSGYADGSTANTRAFTDDGWLNTGDLGYVFNGVLTVTGSAADAIWIDGVLHHGHEIETTVAELPFIDKMYVAACLVTNEVSGASELAISYHHDESVLRAEAASEIRKLVMSRHGLATQHVVSISKEGFPKTRTGKPQYAKLQTICQSNIAHLGSY